MLFHKAKQLCLFQVPKTGTTTARNFLPAIGWKYLPPEHGEPAHFLSHYPNLNNYKMFAFVRNPLQRFESSILFLKALHTERFFQEVLDKVGLDKPIKDVSYDDFVDYFDAFDKRYPIILDRQVKWFSDSRVEALDFDNYETELRKICETTNPQKRPIGWLNSTKAVAKSEITQKVIDFVRSHYAADYALAKDRLGKEY